MLMSMVLALAVLQQVLPANSLPCLSGHPPQHLAERALHALCRLVVELARRDAFDERRSFCRSANWRLWVNAPFEANCALAAPGPAVPVIAPGSCLVSHNADGARVRRLRDSRLAEDLLRHVEP